MRISTSTPPVVRETAVVLTDRELALVSRALYKDNSPGDIGNDTRRLWNEFDLLRSRLDIEDLDEQ